MFINNKNFSNHETGDHKGLVRNMQDYPAITAGPLTQHVWE